MKKIGLICLAVVLAVGALGVGYAAWTDTVTISGTVNTGSVDLEIVNLSSTYVYKDLDDDSMVVRYVVTDTAGNLIHESVAIPGGTAGTDYLVVASAVATADPATDSVTFTYTNVFPSVDFVCDVLLHYSGSVPVKVDIDWTIDSENPTGWFTNLLALALVPGSEEGAVGYARMFDIETMEFGATVDDGTQLEYCDYVKVWFIMHLPQTAPMNAEASVTATFEVIQWNEAP